MSLEIPRRKLLLGALGLIAAPSIVRAASLMPVKQWRDEWRFVHTVQYLPNIPHYFREPFTVAYWIRADGHVAEVTWEFDKKMKAWRAA